MKCIVRIKSTGHYYGPPGHAVPTREEAHIYNERNVDDWDHLSSMIGRPIARRLLVLEVLPNER